VTATTYTAWARWKAGSWQPVAEGASQAEALRLLLAAVKEWGKVPISSAVLPKGAHPEDKAELAVGVKRP
jgi:hypothetical protein